MHRSVSEERLAEYIYYVLVRLFVECIPFVDGEDEAGAAGRIVPGVAALELDVLVQG